MSLVVTVMRYVGKRVALLNGKVTWLHGNIGDGMLVIDIIKFNFDHVCKCFQMLVATQSSFF